LKYWVCGEPHLLINCLYKNVANKTIQNIQEASTVGEIGKIIHRINASLDRRKVDHQFTISEIEDKIHNNKVYILIHPRASLSYVTPTLIDSNKIKKVKHANLGYFN
jgi:hypothetical protein